MPLSDEFDEVDRLVAVFGETIHHQGGGIGDDLVEAGDPRGVNPLATLRNVRWSGGSIEMITRI